MAGMDFSHVVEPDYEERLVAQDQKVTDYVKALSEQLPRLYFDPPEPPEKQRELRVGETFVRHKNIYYDTDGINEAQLESLSDCNNCRGVLRIESTSSVHPPCVGIEIPLDACNTCLEEGYRLLEDAQLKGGFRYIQLIDRHARQVHRYGF
jgi:hypothetical protein